MAMFRGEFGRGREADVYLGAFQPGHIGLLVGLMRANAWTIDDAYGPDHEATFLRLAAQPDTLFFTVYHEGGQVGGVVYLAGILPGRTAWANGYGLPMHPGKPIRALRLLTAYGFEILRLKKLTTEHAAANRVVTLVCLRAGYGGPLTVQPSGWSHPIPCEGYLRNQRSHLGQAHDALVLGLTREEYEHGRRR